MINKIKNILGLNKYNFKRTYQSTHISKFELNVPVTRYVTKDKLIGKLEKPIFYIQINKIHKTLETFIGNDPLPFVLLRYNDIYNVPADEFKMIKIFINTVAKHPGYTIVEQDTTHATEVILDQAIYITDEEYLRDDVAGTRKVFCNDSKSLFITYYNQNRKAMLKHFLDFNEDNKSLHQCLVYLNEINKSPELFRKMEEI